VTLTEKLFPRPTLGRCAQQHKQTNEGELAMNTQTTTNVADSVHYLLWAESTVGNAIEMESMLVAAAERGLRVPNISTLGYASRAEFWSAYKSGPTNIRVETARTIIKWWDHAVKTNPNLEIEGERLGFTRRVNATRRQLREGALLSETDAHGSHWGRALIGRAFTR
jgi:hypothetical protein